MRAERQGKTSRGARSEKRGVTKKKVSRPITNPSQWPPRPREAERGTSEGQARRAYPSATYFARLVGLRRIEGNEFSRASRLRQPLSSSHG